MARVHLAFLWHMHQPFYLDLATRRLWMQWVRLHGVKDYTGMALLHEEFPAIRSTINFSPSLLDQIDAYAAGAEDQVLAASRKAPSALTDDERAFLRRQLCLAHPDNHIRAHPRFAELEKKSRSRSSLSDGELLDLETIAALAWVHPIVFERDAELAALRRKGRAFTTSDRDAVLAKHLSLLGAVIPRWKALQERGQVEVSVSPYYHPILPLLCDFRAVHDALPSTPLPAMAAPLTPDAAEHVRRARARGAEAFGRPPAGCWPSEGSVSADACALLASHGFRWCATDEEILARSLDLPLDRGTGADALYAPYRLGDMTLVFRDQVLSNLVSFTYKMKRPAEAADDFMGRLHAVADSSSEDRLVVVALDGENPWEHYAGNAVDFLRELFGRLSGDGRVNTCTMSEGIAAIGTPRMLPRLFAGSWINHSFAVWAGHDEDRRAWEMLGRVREKLAATPQAPAIAWESLLAAEGSDWFWWFGEDYSSPQDAEFDALFRRHLTNACTLASIAPPDELARPVKGRRRDDLYRRPAAMLNVRIDGRRTDYFEWIEAGRYDLAREFGAMAGEVSFLSQLLFGYDAHNLLLRLDFRPGLDPRELLHHAILRAVAVAPEHRTVVLWPPADGVDSALGEIFEAACPVSHLGGRQGAELQFHVEIERPGAPPVRLPTLAPLAIRVPETTRDVRDWDV
jgi:alpha-amylase/alpha-mannosidase (GH57 family)